MMNKIKKKKDFALFSSPLKLFQVMTSECFATHLYDFAPSLYNTTYIHFRMWNLIYLIYPYMKLFPLDGKWNTY